jgi:hypothetical protein
MAGDSSGLSRSVSAELDVLLRCGSQPPYTVCVFPLLWPFAFPRWHEDWCFFPPSSTFSSNLVLKTQEVAPPFTVHCVHPTETSALDAALHNAELWLSGA